MRMYAIWDNAAMAYLRPFFQETDGLAVRAFRELIKSDKRVFDYAGDYALFYMADVDEHTGGVDAPLAPMRVVTGHEITGELAQLPSSGFGPAQPDNLAELVKEAK